MLDVDTSANLAVPARLPIRFSRKLPQDCTVGAVSDSLVAGKYRLSFPSCRTAVARQAREKTGEAEREGRRKARTYGF